MQGDGGMSDGEYLVPTSFWKQNKAREYLVRFPNPLALGRASESENLTRENPAVEEGGGQGGGWWVERVQV